MRYEDLRLVFQRLGLGELPEPNHAEWTHTACPFAPWTHNSGIDNSKGFAVKIEDNGVSAFSCPACKKKGRIDAFIRELGRYRNQNLNELASWATRKEAFGVFSGTGTYEELKARKKRDGYEVLGAPLDLDVFNPEEIFDNVDDHPDAIRFCQMRRVSRDGVIKAGIRFDPDKQRLVFPVYRSPDKLYGYTGRSIIPDRHPKVLDYANLPKRALILGEHTWVKGKPLILLEGLIGYARFLTEGVDQRYNVGAILGSAITPGKAAILKEWRLPTYLILDPDAAGFDGIYGPMTKVGKNPYTGHDIEARDPDRGAINMLSDHMHIFAPSYPEGVHDVDDLTFDQVMWMCENAPMKHKRKKKIPTA